MPVHVINLNDIVKVKLNDIGKDICYHKYDEVNEVIRRNGGRLIELRMPEVDDEGYTAFQLWELMMLFGPHIALGEQPPFGTNILYEVQDYAGND